MNKKAIATFITTMLVMLFINGCGTTVKESLGNPPPQAKLESTPYPAGSVITHEVKGEDIVIKGGYGCVESGVMVIVSSEDDELAKTTADSYGAFETRFKKGEVPANNIIYLQAKAHGKDSSLPIRYSLKPFEWLGGL